MRSTRKGARLSAKARAAATIDAEGATVLAICERVPCSRASLARWRGSPRYQSLRASLRAELEEAGGHGVVAALPGAVATMRAAAEGGDVDAAKALWQAYAAQRPPSEAQRRKARTELLRELPSTLRRQVLKHLQAGSSAFLAELSDEELERLYAEGAP